MKKLIAAMLMALAGSAAFANTVDEIPFMPMSPVTLGSGGTGLADAHGWDALFFNPAGFSRDPSAFTLSSSQVWMYSHG